MDKKGLLEKEGLFISEFTDDFFKRKLQSESGLEEFIRGCADKVKKRQKEGGIWHCILDVAVKEVCKKELRYYFDFNKYFDGGYGLQKLMADFYGEPFFLKLDVAQAITYNLCRLGEEYVYDMENDGDVEIWEDDYKAILDIGRKMPEKELMLDLIPGLDRLEEKYNDVVNKSRVYFPRKVDGDKIMLEQKFTGLNVLYIGNEKFQDYLRRSGLKKAYFKDLMGYIEVMDKENEPQQYVWEKMTGFNAINIIAKFLTEIATIRGIQKKDIRGFIEFIQRECHHLFRQIMEMPNVLTKLLLLKHIFSYVPGTDDKMILDYLQNMNILLLEKNDKYKEIQECVLAIAVYTRWMMGEERKIEAWLDELEKEYPITLFEEWMLFVNMGLGWYCKKEINVNMDKIINEWEKKGEMTHLLRALRRNEKEINGKRSGYERKDILKAIKDFRYFEYRKELSKRLQEQGWFHISSDNLLENMRRQQEKASELTPLGSICTKTYSELRGEEGVEFIETVEEVEKALRSCLLSDYKNVIFENTFMEEQQTYEEIMNFLLYHI